MIRIKKVLIYGFKPFYKYNFNPSEHIAKFLYFLGEPNCKIDCLILPVSYKKSSQLLFSTLNRNFYDYILGFGLNAKIDCFNFERVSLNLIDASIPDNDNVLIKNKAIMKQGEKAYFSNVDLEKLSNLATNMGVPIKISNFAGTYLCNFIMFLINYHLNRYSLPSKFLFIHTPLPSEMPESNSNLKFIELLKYSYIIFKLLILLDHF